MRILLLIIPLLFCSNINAQNTFLPLKGNIVSVELLDSKVPIVEGKLNGKKTYFLIDTGSTISVLDVSKRKDYGFRIFRYITKKLHGFGGSSLDLWLLYDVDLLIGEKIITTKYAGTHLQELRRQINIKTGYEISGILGSDAIRDFGIIVDFVSQRCYIGVGKDKKFKNEIALE